MGCRRWVCATAGEPPSERGQYQTGRDEHGVGADDVVGVGDGEDDDVGGGGGCAAADEKTSRAVSHHQLSFGDDAHLG